MLTGRGKSRAETSIQEQYIKDASVYSWAGGSHPAIIQARRRCRAIEGLEEVLLKLTLFNPEERPSYETVLQHAVFHPLRSAGVSSERRYTIDVNRIRSLFEKKL